jgi:16S rRNA (adenine1518-N6/adenine1519-N6)-dimethyltransferase
VKAKKSFGQHFLTNPHIRERIAHVSSYSSTHNVLEVGPGKGALTSYLLPQDIHLKVVEADRDMIEYLLDESELSLQKDQIIAEDFLKVDLAEVFDGNPFVLIGNYPYNISSQIIIKMLETRAFIPEMVGMFQKEVADRIISRKGTKTYGTLSVMTQVYYDVEKVMNIAPGNFAPPPKVDSAVIHCIRKSEPLYHGEFQYLQTVVRSIFGKRRKMVRNSLKPLFSKEALAELPYLTLRPEQMEVEQFVELAQIFEAYVLNGQQSSED